MNQSEKCIDRINNVFVKNVVRSWCTVAYDSNINTMYDDQIIWNNSYIRIDNNIQYKCNWLNNGVKYLKDLMDDNGKVFLYNGFRAKYPGVKCHFMDYFALIHAIPHVWKKSIHMVDRVNHNNWQKELIEDMCKATKVCRFIQNMCVNQIFKTPKSETKWAMHMNDANLNWTVIYTIPFKVSLSTKLRYFQFQFLHKYLPLNKFLFDINIVDSKLCSFCKQEDETSDHLFWECRITKSFWSDVQLKILNNNINITDKDVYFGIMNMFYHLNFILLHAKYHLYCCRCNKIMKNIHHFRSKLKLSCAVEREIALGRDNLNAWKKKWDVLSL